MVRFKLKTSARLKLTSSVQCVETIKHAVGLELVLVAGSFYFLVEVLELGLTLVELSQVALKCKQRTVSAACSTSGDRYTNFPNDAYLLKCNPRVGLVNFNRKSVSNSLYR